MKRAKSFSLVNLPSIAAGTVGFTFTTTIAGGAWTFVFKYANGRWNGWATLPTGEVRPFGCVPSVVDWSGFLDYGIVIISSLAALGLLDLASSGTSLVVVGWA